MLEFEVLQELEPNEKVIKLLKNCTYEIKNGRKKHLKHTNLQIIEPIEYKVTFPISLTILEYPINEIQNKPFYVKEHNQKYNLKELTSFVSF